MVHILLQKKNELRKEKGKTSAFFKKFVGRSWPPRNETESQTAWNLFIYYIMVLTHDLGLASVILYVKDLVQYTRIGSVENPLQAWNLLPSRGQDF